MAARSSNRIFRAFGRVHGGEALQVALMLVCVLLIMTSYYMLKTAREALILSKASQVPAPEVKAYAGGAMAVLLIVMIPAYDALAARMSRLRLINTSYAIVTGCVLAFYGLHAFGVPISLAFFIWIGIAGVFLVAQFWSYANDIYTEEQGERLFAIIAIGGSIGSVLGPWIATELHTMPLLPLGAAVLAVCAVLFNAIERVHRANAARHPVALDDEPIRGDGGFRLVRQDHYLMLIAGLVLVGTLVNTTGEYVLSSVATDHASTIVSASAHADLVGPARAAAIAADRREVIKAFYGDFFLLVNVTGFLIQAFVVSRAIRVLGVRRALFVMPLIALGVYGAIGAIGGLALVRAAKVMENGADYSLENTLRQLLFLPTARSVKYKAKAAIDTFVVRAGDALAAVLVGGGIHLVGLHVRGFAFVNVALVVVWIAIAFGIAQRHRLFNTERA